MATPAAQLEAIIDLLTSLGISVRQENLGGTGGGFCTVRGERVLFLDTDADSATQLDRSVAALASIPELDDVYMIPALRERIERWRAQHS